MSPFSPLCSVTWFELHRLRIFSYENSVMCDIQASIKMIKTSVFDDMYSASINTISINKFQSDGGQKFVASYFIYCLAKLLFSFTICKLRSRSLPGDLPAGSPRMLAHREGLLWPAEATGRWPRAVARGGRDPAGWRSP